MKSIYMGCGECGNYFGIVSFRDIEEPCCPSCGSTDVDYASEEREDRIIEAMNQQ